MMINPTRTMKRRDAIGQMLVLTGGVLITPALMSNTTHCLIGNGELVITPEREALLAEIADCIIPTTDTPGAKAAGVEKFMVRVITDCFEPAEQEKFYTNLTRFAEASRSEFGTEFAQLSPAQKTAMLQDTIRTDKDFFLFLKQLTVTGYFNSEIGATQTLAHLPVPGRFDGCVPLQKGQKTWSL